MYTYMLTCAFVCALVCQSLNGQDVKSRSNPNLFMIMFNLKNHI